MAKLSLKSVRITVRSIEMTSVRNAVTTPCDVSWQHYYRVIASTSQGLTTSVWAS